MPDLKFKASDPVHLIRDPSACGFVKHAYERGILLIHFFDGTEELCQPEEVEPERGHSPSEGGTVE